MILRLKKKRRKHKIESHLNLKLAGGIKLDLMYLQPYRLVKDNRTNFESTSPDKVLNGEIDEFLEHSLYQIK